MAPGDPNRGLLLAADNVPESLAGQGMPDRIWRDLGLVVLGLLLAGCGACRLDMHVQPKYTPLRGSTFFPDGRSERPVVPGTVPHGELRTDELRYTGRINGVVADVFPFPIKRGDLERG